MTIDPEVLAQAVEAAKAKRGELIAQPLSRVWGPIVEAAITEAVLAERERCIAVAEAHAHVFKRPLYYASRHGRGVVDGCEAVAWAIKSGVRP